MVPKNLLEPFTCAWKVKPRRWVCATRRSIDGILFYERVFSDTGSFWLLQSAACCSSTDFATYSYIPDISHPIVLNDGIQLSMISVPAESMERNVSATFAM